MKDKTIVALDQMDQAQIEHFLERYQSSLSSIKLGMEYFYRYGRAGVSGLQKRCPGLQVFLDLKLHDIPVTVEHAIRSLEGLSLKFLTLHLAGGPQMIEFALRARENYLPDTQLLGVTYLTSLGPDDLKRQYNLELPQAFERLLPLALESEMDGIICSPLDLLLIKKLDPSHQLTRITPGIRFSDTLRGDQKRVMDPHMAWSQGSDYIVIGRALTQAEDPQLIFDRLYQTP